MTGKQGTTSMIDVKALLEGDGDCLRAMVRAVVEATLEAEMTVALGAEKGERSEGRLGYRSGTYGRTLVTRVGTLELRVPQDREGRFSTRLFERYQRSEKALVAALAEMYVQGVSTRKVKAITEELCGHAFSASAISAVNKTLDAELAAFMGRELTETAFPYLILDARYEKVREGGVIRSRAVQVAIGVDWEGRRNVPAVELANRESATSWKDFLVGLKARGLDGVEFVVSDDHEGSGGRSARCCPRRPGSAVTCTCLEQRARPPAAQGRRRLPAGAALALRPARPRRGAPGPRPLARQVAGEAPEALRLGRGEHRGDLHLLPIAPAASQAHEVDEHARAAERGDQAPHACRAYLPECCELPAAGACARRGDPRELAGSQPLPEHG